MSRRRGSSATRQEAIDTDDVIQHRIIRGERRLAAVVRSGKFIVRRHGSAGCSWRDVDVAYSTVEVLPVGVGKNAGAIVTQGRVLELAEFLSPGETIELARRLAASDGDQEGQPSPSGGRRRSPSQKRALGQITLAGPTAQHWVVVRRPGVDSPPRHA